MKTYQGSYEKTEAKSDVKFSFIKFAVYLNRSLVVIAGVIDYY